jgi:protein-arginine kinase activator protein McsA
MMAYCAKYKLDFLQGVKEVVRRSLQAEGFLPDPEECMHKTVYWMGGRYKRLICDDCAYEFPDVADPERMIQLHQEKLTERRERKEKCDRGDHEWETRKEGKKEILVCKYCTMTFEEQAQKKKKKTTEVEGQNE